MAKSAKNGQVTQRQAVRMFFERDGKTVSNEELDDLGRGTIRRWAPECARQIGVTLRSQR